MQYLFTFIPYYRLLRYMIRFLSSIPPKTILKCWICLIVLFVLNELLTRHDRLNSELLLRQLSQHDIVNSDSIKCETDERVIKERQQVFINYETMYEFAETDIVPKDRRYDGSRHILSFLHIQKTGGSRFAAEINANQTREGNKTGLNMGNTLTYKMCGLHADWTAVKGCTENMYHPGSGKNTEVWMLTMLRDPVDRYLSEWLHIRRGSTWLATLTQCSARHQPRPEDPPSCIHANKLGKQLPSMLLPKTSDVNNAVLKILQRNTERMLQRGSQIYRGWEGVNLDNFTACKDNPANNRMVRMLADQSVLGENCDERRTLSQADRDHRLFESAKENLRNMAAFGLTDYPKHTKKLLSAMLGVTLSNTDSNSEVREETNVACISLTDREKGKIRNLNHLDVELYHYAKDLFYARLKGHRVI